MHQRFCCGLIVLSKLYKTAFKVALQVAQQKSYGQLKMAEFRTLQACRGVNCGRISKIFYFHLHSYLEMPIKFNFLSKIFLLLKKRRCMFFCRFWSKFKNAQKWCQIKGLEVHFWNMAINNFLKRPMTFFDPN